MSEVKLDASGLTTPSIVLGNNVLTSEEDKLIWNGEEFKSGGGHNVGEQWISMDGTIPFGGVPFNGQILNIADYQPLYNWAKDNGRIKTESEWQTLKTNNNSNVAYYSDYSSTQFRMPLFRGYLKADSGSGYIKQGLPNITGSIQANTNDTVTAYTGAFYADNSQSGGGDSGGSGGFARFDASRSNAIYGRSSNVTPETSKMLVGVYAFNTVVNGTIFDAADEITSDILVSIAKPHLHIGYPYSDSSGALLALRSVNYSNNPGGFELIVDDSTNQKSLIGKTDGTFTWAGKPIVTLTASWRSGKNWYRKYSDGWIEQGGLINYGSSAGSWNKSISLNTSFTSTNYNVVASFYEGDPAGDRYQQNGINIISLTTSSFHVYQCGGDAIQYITWYACGY